ncbi:MAG: neuromedin U [Pseudanabaena sp.]|nr:MAG: neuromedin U [Pseudanabaena sp.]
MQGFLFSNLQENMLKSLQKFVLLTSLSQISWTATCLIAQSSLANPDLITSPNSEAIHLQENAMLSDRKPIESSAPFPIEAETKLAQVNIDIPDRNASISAKDLMPIESNLAIVAQTDPTAAPAETATEQSASAQKTENLAKSAQNPIANLISVPFQFNFNFGVGPNDRTQYLLNIQPVIPTSLNDDWLLVSRIITPVLVQPVPINSDRFGLGDINPSFFFVPKQPGDFTWGIGPVLSFPTATDPALGTGKWSVGPTAVAVWSPGKWVVGALANQQWSVAGDDNRAAVSQFLFQPFINYNMPDGWFLSFSPVITANWNASSGNQWTVPIGGGVGRVFRIDKQPVNVSLAAFWNVIRPEFGADWQIRFQFAFLFPTGG